MHVVTRGVRHAVPMPVVERAGITAMKAIRCPAGAELEVALVGDAEIARLHRRYLGRRGPTDVITFPGTAAPGDPAIGEVVISVDRARAQARQAGWPIRREVALLVVHGVLHLGGYDDHTSAGSARMRAAERRILRRLVRAGR